MEKSPFSQSWYRVERARPRLRSHVKIHRHHFRGELWYVIQDRTSGRFLRFTPAAYLILSLMNGRRSVQEVWDLACEQLGDDVLTQDELIAMLAQLHQSDLLRGDGVPDVGEISERARREKRRRKVMSVINPLAVRIPLIDPDRFLGATLPLVRPLLGWAGAAIFVSVTATAVVLAALNWSALTSNIFDRVFAAESLLLLLLTYPIVKAFHELGHGYVLKHWGGEVHEMGLMFLVFLPVPYVDASDAAAIREKWRRALVGAAGILVEVLLASIALFVWLNAEEGLVSAVAFNVMLIGGVSTVFFNGNPLLRFDGYYVFSDLLESPNLGHRANRYLGYLIQRHLFAVEDASPPSSGPGEVRWLVAYSIASFCYRTFIMVAIVAIVATQFFVVGVLLAVWALILMLGLPLAKQLHFLFTSPVLRRNRRRAFGVTGSFVAFVLTFTLLIPLPYSTPAQGIVWTPDEATVYATASGTVAEIIVEPNTLVTPGDPLIRLDDDFLDARAKILAAQVMELRLTYEARDFVDQAEARIVNERLQHAEADLELTLQRQRDLLIRSKVEGRFIVPAAADLPGRFVRQGEVLSHIGAPAQSVIRVVVPEDQADLVRTRASRVELKFPGHLGATVGAIVTREVPALSDTLPSLALSTLGGGDIIVDPTNPDRATALANLMQFELRPESADRLPPLGSRVYVRFIHGTEPLARRLYRGIRQVFLRRFNV